MLNVSTNEAIGIKKRFLGILECNTVLVTIDSIPRFIPIKIHVKI